MLRELSIKNFAIIEDLRIPFGEGLTILSGETGAGKSVIINAVNLLLGSRAAATLVRTGAEAAELEALFDLPQGSAVAQTLADNGYDAEEGLLVRRLIARNDRHRVYINGRLATMQVLNTITGNLASIASQHAQQGLLREELHLDILDQFGGLAPKREAVAALVREIQPLIQHLASLKSQQVKQSEQIELLRFQQQEIDAAKIHPGEDEVLEQERQRLRHIQALQQAVGVCVDGLYAAEGAVSEQLAAIIRQLTTAAGIDAQLQPQLERLSELAYQTEDIAEELRRYLAGVESDDQRLEEVEVRLDALNRLKRKYGGSLSHILESAAAIDQRLDALERLDTRIVETEQSLADLHGRLAQQVRTLSKERGKVAETLGRRVARELASLEMPRTRFEIVLEGLPADDKTPPSLTVDGRRVEERGFERAAFLISPNVGEALKPLSAIASGGELSRVVLAIKAILAASDAIETIVFDEVDAGIGGRVAEVVGQKLKALTRHHQIICITHLAQIAKFGDGHFKIAKQVRDGRTLTVIEPLAGEQRLEEIARLLGGARITDKTLAHAREMLADQGKPTSGAA